MPYKDPERQRKYQRAWMARRRQEWFDANGPCAVCGSDQDLQLDHEDPKHKISHRVWSWSSERRARELAKCRALCGPCHKKKSRDESPRGESHGQAKLSVIQVAEIRASSLSSYELGRRYGVHSVTIQRIRNGKRWTSA